MADSSQNNTENSSIDIVSLNNMVVNLRSLTKKSKVQVMQKLTKTIKALKQKSSNPNDNRHKRAEKLTEELQVLRTTNVDDITKFCLIQSGAAHGSVKNREQAAMVRVAKHKIISKKIEDLRKEHQDWDSLVFFIKNHVPRRVKKNSSKKPKEKPTKKSVKPKIDVLPIEDVHMEEQVEEKPIAPEDTVEKLKGFGGVVCAFDADDDCDAKDIPTETIKVTDESKTNASHKSSKKKFFEGCDDGDDDDNNVASESSDVENDMAKRKTSFKKNNHHSSPKKPFKKFTNRDKHQQNNTQVKKFDNGEKRPAAKRKPSEPLHPSWEAKRKEKELMKLKPQSKKIVFDD